MAAITQLKALRAGLDSKLSVTPLSKSLRRELINGIFNRHLTEEHFRELDDLEAYFSDWYEEQCEVVAGQISITSHKDVLDIIAYLRANNLSRSRTFDHFLRLNPSTDHGLLNASLDLAARLWLVVSIGSIRQALTPSNNTIAWDNDTLSVALHETLWPKSSLGEKIKLPKNFTAANIEKIAGLKVIWTSNLADHLCLRDDDTRVMLFHQTTFLELHKDTRNLALPDDLIEETTRTLGLLIPSVDKRSKVWFRQRQKALNLDPKAGTYGPLNASARQIEHFNYWRDRLVMLKQTFDEAEPHTLRLWWYDDRKKVQWYTFWIAALVLLLTVVFGLTQSVAGIVQAWAAVKSLPN